jgi:hypothetical protein
VCVVGIVVRPAQGSCLVMLLVMSIVSSSFVLSLMYAVKWLTGKSTVATVGSDARQVGLRFVTGFGEAFRYCRRVTVDDHSSLHFQDLTSILDLIGAVVKIYKACSTQYGNHLTRNIISTLLFYRYA